MPRPRKSAEELRVKFDALYVTAAEKVDIKAAAAAASMSVSQYLIALHRGEAPHRSQRRSEVLSAFIAAERQLERLARLIPEAISPMDTSTIFAHLIDIQRGFRRTALLPAALRNEHVNAAPKDGGSS